MSNDEEKSKKILSEVYIESMENEQLLITRNFQMFLQQQSVYNYLLFFFFECMLCTELKVAIQDDHYKLQNIFYGNVRIIYKILNSRRGLNSFLCPTIVTTEITSFSFHSKSFKNSIFLSLSPNRALPTLLIPAVCWTRVACEPSENGLVRQDCPFS